MWQSSKDESEKKFHESKTWNFKGTCKSTIHHTGAVIPWFCLKSRWCTDCAQSSQTLSPHLTEQCWENTLTLTQTHWLCFVCIHVCTYTFTHFTYILIYTYVYTIYMYILYIRTPDFCIWFLRCLGHFHTTFPIKQTVRWNYACSETTLRHAVENISDLWLCISITRGE